MKAVCAWCLKDGKPEDEALIGEKEPLEDERETHGICGTHRQEIEDHVTRLRAEAERRRQQAARERVEAEQRQVEAERQGEEIEALRKKVDP
ncbi:MAG TPA: hypothetical protein VJA45_04130 [Methylomirabilota bacterium]|nr:hypothetical protein [Methylomirabilota bacterium]